MGGWLEIIMLTYLCHKCLCRLAKPVLQRCLRWKREVLDHATWYILSIALIATITEFVGEERAPGQRSKSSWTGLVWSRWRKCPERSWLLREHKRRVIPPSHECPLQLLRDTALVSAVPGTGCDVHQVWTLVPALSPRVLQALYTSSILSQAKWKWKYPPCRF